ncbi:MAG: hypothetical protein HYR89_01735, partial [Actinobacteria bacterium]|nr:hypothetical protein [Actinomycetota bacterium]
MDSSGGVLVVVVGIGMVAVVAILVRRVAVLLDAQRRATITGAHGTGDGISDQLRLVIEEQQRIAQAQFHEALTEQQRLAGEQLDTIVRQLVVTNRTQLEGARAQ